MKTAPRRFAAGSGLLRLGPPGADLVDLLEDGVALPAVLGGGEAGLELGQLLLAPVARVQLLATFDHVFCPACPVNRDGPPARGDGGPDEQVSYTPRRIGQGRLAH